MRRFRFRPQRVERLRRLERDEARARLGTATAERDALCLRISLLERRAATTLEQLRRSLAPGESVRGEAVRELGDRLDVLARATRRLLEMERAAAAHEASCRMEHDERSRAHRVLVRLRERRKKRWRIAIEREEQRLLDELHLLRAVASETGGEASQ